MSEILKNGHQQLIHLPTLPAYCNHFTLGNPKKSFFNSVIHTDFTLLHYLRRNKLQLLYCSLSVYLLLFTASYYLHSSILWSVFNLLGQSFSKPPMPTHNWLFLESPTFGGTQHSLQSDVRVLHFTR